MEKIILILFFLFPLPSYSFTEEIKRLEAEIEAIGTLVKWSWGHRECTSEGLLYGMYIPSKDIIIMCQANHKKDYIELVKTLKHEGWHAAQHKCNSYRSVLTDEQLRLGLKDSDSKILHDYHPKQQRAEAEARVLEYVPTEEWIRGFRAYCFE